MGRRLARKKFAQCNCSNQLLDFTAGAAGAAGADVCMREDLQAVFSKVKMNVRGLESQYSQGGSKHPT